MHPKRIAFTTSFMDSIRKALVQQYDGGQIVLTKLRDGSGAIAVLPMREDGKGNARIYNTSGNVRCEIEIPHCFRGGIGFSDAYYVNDELTAIFVTPGRDFAFVIDEKSGNAIRTYETR